MRDMADQRGVATVRIDNERVRVTEWRFAPGATTGFHRHEYDYVVVPMSTGRLASTGPAGESVAELVTGLPYFRPAGVEHDVRNANAFEFTFIEIELKRPRRGGTERSGNPRFLDQPLRHGAHPTGQPPTTLASAPSSSRAACQLRLRVMGGIVARRAIVGAPRRDVWPRTSCSTSRSATASR